MAVSYNPKAVQKYVKKNYDRLIITVNKGRKDIIKAAADSCGQSMNAFIVAAIDERMAKLQDGATTSGSDPQ